MTHPARPARRTSTGVILELLVLAVAVAMVAWTGRGLLDRAVHAPRYATTGGTTIAPMAYVAATRHVLPRGVRIARLTLPHGGGPVIVSAWPATGVYLDPPTARVLDVAAGHLVEGAAIPALAAQSIGSVIARARPYADGALESVDWPTQRSPDWTITFGDGAQVKVADDSGTARAAPVRRPSRAVELASQFGHQARGNVAWQVAIFLTGIVAALLAAIRLVRLSRRRRSSSSP